MASSIDAGSIAQEWRREVRILAQERFSFVMLWRLIYVSYYYLIS